MERLLCTKKWCSATVALYEAVLQSTNNERGENTKGNNNIISNGSKIIVPEGMALITIQDGNITGCITEVGGFEYKSDDVNLKEIPNNKFGTKSTTYFNDSFLGTQVGVIASGTYTLQIVDPLIFVKNFVPTKYLQVSSPVFDLSDLSNDSSNQLFNKVVATLSVSLSNYTNNPNKENKIINIQADQIGFASAMSKAVEDAYQW